MGFRDDGDAARARADALARELDETADELAAAQAELASLREEKSQRAAAEAKLAKLAKLAGAAPRAEPEPRAPDAEPTKLEQKFGALTRQGQQGQRMLAIFISVLASFFVVGAYVLAPLWVAALSLGLVLAFDAWLIHRSRPEVSLARAHAAIEEVRGWVRTRPYTLHGCPELVARYAGDTLVLKLEFADEPPTDLEAIVRGAGGEVIERGWVAFEFGTMEGTHTNPDGSSVRTEYMVPMRGLERLRELDPKLLTPLAEAHALEEVHAYLGLSDSLDPELVVQLAKQPA